MPQQQLVALGNFEKTSFIIQKSWRVESTPGVTQQGWVWGSETQGSAFTGAEGGVPRASQVRFIGEF